MDLCDRYVFENFGENLTEDEKIIVQEILDICKFQPEKIEIDGELDLSDSCYAYENKSLMNCCKGDKITKALFYILSFQEDFKNSGWNYFTDFIKKIT